MATIEKRISKDGKTSYRVNIRKKGIEIMRTFYDKETANLFVYYKENLINNMQNFEVPLQNRITLLQIFELKESAMDDKSSLNHIKNAKIKLCDYFKEKIFYNEISLEEWIEAAKFLYTTDVYKGAKTENSKRKMSANTLRNIFAYASAAISYAQNKGIEIENNAQKVMNIYILPLIKESKNQSETLSFERQKEISREIQNKIFPRDLHLSIVK